MNFSKKKTLNYLFLIFFSSDSFSEIRLVINKQTNLEYIAKLIRLDSDENRIQAATEFECLHRLCHSNIVQLYDAIISDHTFYLISEK